MLYLLENFRSLLGVVLISVVTSGFLSAQSDTTAWLFAGEGTGSAEFLADNLEASLTLQPSVYYLLDKHWVLGASLPMTFTTNSYRSQGLLASSRFLFAHPYSHFQAYLRADAGYIGTETLIQGFPDRQASGRWLKLGGGVGGIYWLQQVGIDLSLMTSYHILLPSNELIPTNPLTLRIGLIGIWTPKK